eukprot:3601337-Pyramimonas_sp.AAC.1
MLHACVYACIHTGNTGNTLETHPFRPPLDPLRRPCGPPLQGVIAPRELFHCADAALRIPHRYNPTPHVALRIPHRYNPTPRVALRIPHRYTAGAPA